MTDQAPSPGGAQSSGFHDASAAVGAFHDLARRQSMFHTPAGASRTSIALLEDFGRTLGLPALYFGADDCCWLNIGGDHITCIATFGDAGFLRIHGEVEELPAERDEPDVSNYFLGLLTRNAVIVGRGDIFPFAIDPRRNALVLTTTLPVTATGQQLHDAMEALVEQLTTLKQNPPSVDGGQERKKPMRLTQDDYSGEIRDNGSPAAFQSNTARAIHLTAAPSDVTGELVWRI